VWIPLTALCLAFFVETVDNTLLSIALPTIGRDLGSGTAALQWVVGACSPCPRSGRSIAQTGTPIAMASVMFGLVLHFQYAYGWSPVKPASGTCRSLSP
jgi:hypothetical protein